MMNRRGFMGLGLLNAIGMTSIGRRSSGQTGLGSTLPAHENQTDYRAMFPRLKHEVFLNAAGLNPQSTFAREAGRQFEEYWSLGSAGGRGEKLDLAIKETRQRFAKLIGAESAEIAYVQNTKAGEQIVIDSLPSIRKGGNIVTNDLHFSGSLHNLIGLKKSGLDIRIVKSSNFETDIEQMIAAIDRKTSLVCLTLVSNINGHVEPIEKIVERAHRQGAKVYADIIQAAGIHPFDVKKLGIDFAACSGYKWLYGTHGVGFFFVDKKHQGTTLIDHVFPGRAKPQYPPWASETSGEDFSYSEPEDASRYQTGHLSYYGITVLNAGLKFIEQVGVDQLREHSRELNRRLLKTVDERKFRCITPVKQMGAILTFQFNRLWKLGEKLAKEKLVVGLSTDRIRVSPGIYNNEDDIDRLANFFKNVQG